MHIYLFLFSCQSLINSHHSKHICLRVLQTALVIGIDSQVKGLSHVPWGKERWKLWLQNLVFWDVMNRREAEKGTSGFLITWWGLYKVIWNTTGETPTLEKRERGNPATWALRTPWWPINSSNLIWSSPQSVKMDILSKSVQCNLLI